MARGEASPVRLYAEDDVRLPRRLSTFLKDQIEALSTTVLEGGLSQDGYKEFTGQIRGLKTALIECERLTKEISG
jgi:hypothetical protein